MSKAKPLKQQATRHTLAESKAAIAQAAKTAPIPARVALLSHALGIAINAAKNHGYTVIWREAIMYEVDGNTGNYVDGLDQIRRGHIYAAVVFKAAADEDKLPGDASDSEWQR